MRDLVKGIIQFRSASRKNLRYLRSEGDEGMRRRDWPKAIKSYRDYLVHRPNDGAILVQFGHALKETQQLSAAKIAYSKAASVASDNNDARLHLENLLRTMGQLDEISALKQVEHRVRDVVIAPSSPLSDKPIDFQNASHCVIADWERDRQNWREAARHYSQHLKDRIDDAGIWVQLGHMLKEATFFDEAIYAYSVAKRMERQPSDVSIHLANLLAHLGRVSDANPLWAKMFESRETILQRNW